jgi:hypothetical protein
MNLERIYRCYSNFPSNEKNVNLCKSENSVPGKIAVDLGLQNTKEMRIIISDVLRISGLNVTCLHFFTLLLSTQLSTFDFRFLLSQITSNSTKRHQPDLIAVNVKRHKDTHVGYCEILYA